MIAWSFLCNLISFSQQLSIVDLVYQEKEVCWLGNHQPLAQYHECCCHLEDIHECIHGHDRLYKVGLTKYCASLPLKSKRETKIRGRWMLSMEAGEVLDADICSCAW